MEIIDDDLLLAFRLRGRCEWCGQAKPTVGHHYWYKKGMGGHGHIDHPWNLIALCVFCHQSSHDGHEPLKTDCLAKVSAREGVLQDDIIAELLRIRNLPKAPVALRQPRKKGRWKR